MLLLQFSTLGPLSLVSGRGWGEGVVHHGCSVRDHGVGVGGGAGSGELPQCGELIYGGMRPGEMMKWVIYWEKQ